MDSFIFVLVLACFIAWTEANSARLSLANPVASNMTRSSATADASSFYSSTTNKFSKSRNHYLFLVNVPSKIALTPNKTKSIKSDEEDEWIFFVYCQYCISKHSVKGRWTKGSR
eukprot:Awhi_evm1s8921